MRDGKGKVEMHDETTRDWIATEGGATIGEPGPEGGRVLADAEWADPDDPEDADARLTLEEDGLGFRTVAVLYGGWYSRSDWFFNRSEADQALEILRTDLERLAAMIPYEGEPNIPERVKLLLDAAFEANEKSLPGAQDPSAPRTSR
jgi:hypothetical protein